MPLLSESPVPVKVLYGNGGGTGGPAGWSHGLGFHVGEGAGGTPADIYAFLNWMSGTIETFVIGGVETDRIVPLRHPYLPAMVAEEVRWDFTGRPTDAEPGWTDAKIWVEFRTPLYNIGGDAPYYTIQTRFGGEFDKLPNAAMAFSDGTRIAGDWGVFVPEIAMVVTTYQSPVAVGATIAGLVGKVNSAPFLGWGVGTVRFDGVESNFSRTVLSQVTYVKAFAISFRPRLWNEVMRVNGAVEAPANVSTGLPIYESGDLNALLY